MTLAAVSWDEVGGQLLRAYTTDELGADGYPRAWHRCPACGGPGRTEFGRCWWCLGQGSAKELVRALMERRCERCGHPHRANGGEWTACDDRCRHGGEVRDRELADGLGHYQREARWRVLTTHHLDGSKANLCWWNLAALCQRCHLSVQQRVVMDDPWPYEHSAWFEPHAAGFYASKYLGKELTRAATLARLDELLALERRHTRERLPL